mgnify:CR=1 FL=1
MATKKRRAAGTVNEGSTDGATWTKIPECTTIMVPEISLAYEDATSLDSEGWEEHIPTTLSGGTISLEAAYTADLAAQAMGYMTSRTLVQFRCTLRAEPGQSSGDIFGFAGYVACKVQPATHNQGVMITLEIQISGPVTREAGTAA